MQGHGASAHFLLGARLRNHDGGRRNILPLQAERLVDTRGREATSRENGAALGIQFGHDGVEGVAVQDLSLATAARLRHDREGSFV